MVVANERKQRRRPSPQKRIKRWFNFDQSIPTPQIIALGTATWIVFFGLWTIARLFGWASEVLLPSPISALVALYHLIAFEGFIYDIAISTYRILASFALACAVAVPLGILMGTFRRCEVIFNPFVAAWRYLPAPSFVPLLLMWLGTGDEPKIALLFIGVIFFLLTLIMDHAKRIPAELIQTALTLGATRGQVLFTVVVPAVMPNVVDTMRQMLAAAWTYLVIAEIITATTGIGAVMMRAKRFMHVDQILGAIIMIGVLGLLFDFVFRFAHNRLFFYLRNS